MRLVSIKDVPKGVSSSVSHPEFTTIRKVDEIGELRGDDRRCTVQAIAPLDAGIAGMRHLWLDIHLSLPDDHPSDERLFLYSTAKLMYPLALSDAELAEKAGDERKRKKTACEDSIILNKRLRFNLFFSTKPVPR